ncbi:MAG: EF-hand domain-containing protein [Alphaproteobacteria bacterium]
MLRHPTTCLAVFLLAACGSEPAPDDAPGPDRAAGPQVAAAEPVEKAPDVCGAPLDTNRNGIVEGAEWFSFSGFAFDSWDLDGDGSLTPAEFHACWRALDWGPAEPAFETFDDDNDGAVSKEEFFARDALQKWDTDGDGVLGPRDWPPT